MRIDRERQDGTGYSFAVTRAMDGALIGLCAADRGQNGAWEFGYWYGRPYWGQGYATEAAGPVMRFAFEDKGGGAADGRLVRRQSGLRRGAAQAGLYHDRRGAGLLRRPGLRGALQPGAVDARAICAKEGGMKRHFLRRTAP